jgi:hypothetical protein
MQKNDDAATGTEPECERKRWLQEGIDLYREWVATPEGKAREKLEDALADLRNDPDISASKLCCEFLDLAIRLMGEHLEADTVVDLVQPMTGYFNGVRARAAARSSHEESRLLKVEVFAWLVENRVKFKSKEKAATAVERQQPIAHRTALKWITEWEKLPSASPL